MQDVLRELFDGLYESKVKAHPMSREEYKVWDKAQEILGGNLLDEMIHAQSRSLVEAQYDSFRLGFRLGALLMLELAQPGRATASSTGWGTAAAAEA